MSDNETATGTGARQYPAHWGVPEGRRLSDERVAWVVRNLAEDRVHEDHGYDAAEARSGNYVPHNGKRITRPERLDIMSGSEALARARALGRI